MDAPAFSGGYLRQRAEGASGFFKITSAYWKDLYALSTKVSQERPDKREIEMLFRGIVR
jgi:hypothetical protein